MQLGVVNEEAAERACRELGRCDRLSALSF
jgi:hypothetical protein